MTATTGPDGPSTGAAHSTEGGFSLPDILVGLTIVGVLTLAALRSVTGVVDVAADGDRAADRRQDVERVADSIVLDTARAHGVSGDLGATSYPDELDLVLDETGSAHVTWRRLASGELIREERAGAEVTAREVWLDGTTSDLFTYHDRGGAVLDPQIDGPAVVSLCTVRVRVTLVTVRDGPRARTSATVDAPLLRRGPADPSCP